MPVPPTIVSYTGDGSTSTFTFSFDYINANYVTVRVDGAEVPFAFVGQKSVFIDPPPADQSIVTISRQTSREALVDFTDGSVLVESDLDLANLQLLHVVQEAYDLSGVTLALREDGSLTASGRRITGVGAPVQPSDVVTLEYAEQGMTSQLAAAMDAASAARQHEDGALDAQARADVSASQASSYMNAAFGHATTAEDYSAQALNARDASRNARDRAREARDEANTANGNTQTYMQMAVGAMTNAVEAADAAAASASQIDPDAYHRKDEDFVIERDTSGRPITIRSTSGNFPEWSVVTTEAGRFQFRLDNEPVFELDGLGAESERGRTALTRQKADARYQRLGRTTLNPDGRWQDVLPSRSLETAYTAPEDHAIILNAKTGTNDTFTEFLEAGVWRQRSSRDSNQYLLIPAGTTYRVRNGALQNWYELR